MEQWRILFPFEVSIYWHERKNKLNGVWKNKMAFQLYHVPFKIGGVLNKKKPNRRHTLYSLSLSCPYTHFSFYLFSLLCLSHSLPVCLSLFLSLSLPLSQVSSILFYACLKNKANLHKSCKNNPKPPILYLELTGCSEKFLLFNTSQLYLKKIINPFAYFICFWLLNGISSCYVKFYYYMESMYYHQYYCY